MPEEEPKTGDIEKSGTDYSKLLDEARAESGVRHNFPEKAPEAKVKANFPERTGESNEGKVDKGESKIKGSMVEGVAPAESEPWAGTLLKGTEII